MNLEHPIKAIDHIASNHKYRELNHVKLKLKDSFKQNNMQDIPIIKPNNFYFLTPFKLCYFALLLFSHFILLSFFVFFLDYFSFRSPLSPWKNHSFLQAESKQERYKTTYNLYGGFSKIGCYRRFSPSLSFRLHSPKVMVSGFSLSFV